MAEKLSGITTQYHMFVDNQVLTKDQLNGFIDYFEDQHRLSRVFLHGVGTVCGFKLHHNSPEGTVTLSRGVGVTTDGDLILLRKDIAGSSEKSIDLKEIQFTHFRKFGDNFANYPFFRKKRMVAKQKPSWIYGRYCLSKPKGRNRWGKCPTWETR